MANKYKNYVIALLSITCLLGYNRINAMESDDVSSEGSKPAMPQIIQRGSSFIASELSASDETSEAREYRRLQKAKDEDRLACDDLFPPFEYDKLLGLVSRVLYPKYSILTEYKIKLSEFVFNVNPLALHEFEKFLSENENNLLALAPPENLILAVKMLVETIPHNWYLISRYHPPLTINGNLPLIFICIGVMNDQLKVSVGRVISELVDNPYFYAPGTRSEYIDAINKALSYPGGHDQLLVDRHGKMISDIVQNWFNITLRLARFELEQWESQQVSLDQLLDHYRFIDHQLQQADQKKAYFSGVAKLPQGFALIDVSSERNAENPEFLRAKIQQYKEKDRKKLEAYQAIREELPYLRKLVNWIDTVFDNVRKRGYIT